MELRNFLARWLSVCRPDITLPTLDPKIVLSIPRFAAEVVNGIAVAKNGERTVIVCERPLLDHQVEAFEKFARMTREGIDFVSEPDQHINIRPQIKLLRRYYYSLRSQHENSYGCLSSFWITPNLKPRPPISDNCSRLNPETIRHMILSDLEEWRVLPVGEAGDYIILFCDQPLSREQKRDVEFFYCSQKFEFVSDSEQYPDIKAHFDELLAYYMWEPYFSCYMLGANA